MPDSETPDVITAGVAGVEDATYDSDDSSVMPTLVPRYPDSSDGKSDSDNSESDSDSDSDDDSDYEDEGSDSDGSIILPERDSDGDIMPPLVERYPSSSDGSSDSSDSEGEYD